VPSERVDGVAPGTVVGRSGGRIDVVTPGAIVDKVDDELEPVGIRVPCSEVVVWPGTTGVYVVGRAW
jgi:hypothetical protein